MPINPIYAFYNSWNFSSLLSKSCLRLSLSRSDTFQHIQWQTWKKFVQKWQWNELHPAQVNARQVKSSWRTNRKDVDETAGRRLFEEQTAAIKHDGLSVTWRETLRLGVYGSLLLSVCWRSTWLLVEHFEGWKSLRLHVAVLLVVARWLDHRLQEAPIEMRLLWMWSRKRSINTIIHGFRSSSEAWCMCKICKTSCQHCRSNRAASHFLSFISEQPLGASCWQQSHLYKAPSLFHKNTL